MRSQWADDRTLFSLSGRVRSDWIDYNGHMNVAHFMSAVIPSNSRAFEDLGLGASYLRATGRTMFVGESHARYTKQLGDGEHYVVETRLSDASHNKFTLQHTLRNDDGAVCAELALVCLHVDLAAPKVVAFPPGLPRIA